MNGEGGGAMLRVPRSKHLSPARLVFLLRIVAVKNSTNRKLARSPAAAIGAGSPVAKPARVS